jgi:hypothetical protein
MVLRRILTIIFQWNIAALFFQCFSIWRQISFILQDPSFWTHDELNSVHVQGMVLRRILTIVFHWNIAAPFFRFFSIFSTFRFYCKIQGSELMRDCNRSRNKHWSYAASSQSFSTGTLQLHSSGSSPFGERFRVYCKIQASGLMMDCNRSLTSLVRRPS